jgi:hypothetical protein
MVMQISLHIRYTKYVTEHYNCFLSLHSKTVWAVLVVAAF